VDILLLDLIYLSERRLIGFDEFADLDEATDKDFDFGGRPIN
jgi:hypothetical protein